MTKVQWILEFHALQRKEKMQFESYFKLMKNLLINVLGLNALRPEDEQGKVKPFDVMTDEEKESFLPLIAWVSRPDALKPVVDQLKNEIDNKSATASEDYEKLAAAIDAAGGDMEPILGIDKLNIPKSAIYEKHKKEFVKDASEMNTDIEVDI